MNKGDLSIFLRKIGLIYYLDYVRYYFHKVKNRSKNNRFKSQNPDSILPPDYLMYESFGINYSKYFYGGKEVAEWLKSHFKKHKNLKSINILDWGCGPARVVRHLPEVVNNDCKFYGTDYNKESIQWCQQNIKNVNFSLNNLNPPLPYEDSIFDVIYGISIFTHLSESLHLEWLNELLRVTNKDGIIFLTTHGEIFKNILTTEENKNFDAGKLVVRANVKEGHRVYGAFHPASFLRNLFKKSDFKVSVLEHISGKMVNNLKEQDIWIIQKLED